MAEDLEAVGPVPAEADGPSRSIATAGLQVLQAAEGLRDAAARLTEAEASAVEAERRARLAEEQLALAAAQNAELLGLLETARDGQADAGERMRRAEERLKAASERAQTLEEQLQELASRIELAEAQPRVTVIVDDERAALQEAVAAEVRRPLTSILGLALALKHSDPAWHETKEMVRQLTTSARKLDRLIGNMLDLDRISDGTFELARRWTNLEALVRRVVEESQELAGRDVKVVAEHVAREVDPGIVEQMVDMLLANAARRTAPSDPIWVKIASDQGGDTIAVEDTSTQTPPGLPTIVSAAPSDGGHSHRQTAGGSTGLTLLARLAEIHGGRAWVEERPGGGASFRVLLSDPARDGSGGDSTDGREVALVSEAGQKELDAPADTAVHEAVANTADIGGLPDIEALRDLLTGKSSS